MAIFTTGIHELAGNPSGAQGGIIQIRQTIYKTDQTFNTTGSWFATGLDCTITPTSTNNHILLFCQLTFQPHSAAILLFRVSKPNSNFLERGVSGGGQQCSVGGTQDGSRGAYPSFSLLDTNISTTQSTNYDVQALCTQDSRINGRIQTIEVFLY
ncbi:MAG: hypothetical protein CM15mV31_0140 [uncultured marine virus]|nr:MAG: hypothetical protein CM15mV31_0140 [uncultured marine virus]